METVALRNGAEEVKSLVNVTIFLLRHLLQENPIAFYELVMRCRDRNHQIYGDIDQVLKRFKLLYPNGEIHGSIRNIVLSAVTGDGLEMELGSPIAEPT